MTRKIFYPKELEAKYSEIRTYIPSDRLTSRLPRRACGAPRNDKEALMVQWAVLRAGRVAVLVRCSRCDRRRERQYRLLRPSRTDVVSPPCGFQRAGCVMLGMPHLRRVSRGEQGNL